MNAIKLAAAAALLVASASMAEAKRDSGKIKSFGDCVSSPKTKDYCIQIKIHNETWHDHLRRVDVTAVENTQLNEVPSCAFADATYNKDLRPMGDVKNNRTSYHRAWIDTRCSYRFRIKIDGGQGGTSAHQTTTCKVRVIGGVDSEGAVDKLRNDWYKGGGKAAKTIKAIRSGLAKTGSLSCEVGF